MEQRMELAVQLGADYDIALEVATWAERRGLAGYAVPDHYLYGKAADGNPAPEALIQLAGLARDTSTIDLVSLVSPITFRHPAVLTKSAIDIDRLSGGGRFRLGIGAGWMDEEHEVFGIPYPGRSERFAMLEEALAYVRAALDGADGYDGDRYRLAAFDIRPRPKGQVKLVVGGAGPKKTPYMAGTYADEFNVYARPVETMGARISAAREAAELAGRSPGALSLSTACPPVIGATDAEYQRSLDVAADRFGSPRDEIEQRLSDGGILLGTPGRVAETMGSWADLGIERYYAQTIGPDRSIERFEHVFGLLETARP
jgi:alkanesulfonate monooxygenase SsuD/methylene tetrahydromethanopterin reductase-like flavin-dependent oxidoreductase (luciferase family)